MKSALMVIAPEMFRDEEYAVPKAILERRGAHVSTASTRAGESVGKLGMHANADLALEDAVDRDWDLVVFVGGPGARVFFDDDTAHDIAQSVLASGGITAAICIAPSTLAHAGMLQGVEATAFESQRDDLVAHGAEWTGDPVTVDGRIVTANGPEAANEFGGVLADMLELPRE